MADSSEGAVKSSTQLDSSAVSQTPSTSQTNVIQQEQRFELLNKARAFLRSPQVQHEDAITKRRFLSEKGLTIPEIDSLLQEQPPAVPLIPPRTYPQPPPSNLPNLLVGLARIFAWVAGGSAAMLLVYFRYLYPRLAQTYDARYSIQAHQKNLLGKLTESTSALKATQTEAFSLFPSPQPFKEDAKYEASHTLDELATASEDKKDIPELSLLRCAIEDLLSQNKPSSTEAIFQSLEAKFSWLIADENAKYEEKLWQTLSTHPLFHHEEIDGATIWSYAAPSPPRPSVLSTSLALLKSELPGPRETRRFQHSFQALSDLTGWIVTQTYALPYRGVNSGLNPEEEEVRREIRALKGLVLNRRSFMTGISRPLSTSGSDNVVIP